MSDSSPSSEIPAAPRLARALAGGALGAAIGLACYLPPGLHFVSGPIGPAIGGFIAGSRLQARPAEALIIGLVMGGLMAVVVGSLVGSLVGLLSSSVASLFAGVPDVALAVGAAGLALVHGGSMGAAAAWFGGKQSREA